MKSIKTIERLIVYRQLLEDLISKGIVNVFSHQLSDLTGFTAAQIRRDIMAVGYTGNPRHGYSVKDLRDSIKKLLEPAEGISMVLVGIGNLGHAIIHYFAMMKPKFNIIAAFDIDKEKINEKGLECECYHLDELGKIVSTHPVQLGIISVPASEAQKVTDLLVLAGVKGLVNFSPARIKIPKHVYIENIDLTLTFEKVVFLSKGKKA